MPPGRRLPGATTRPAGWAAVLGSVWLGCQPAPPPNLLLLVVDTLRADHIGAAGPPATPHFDALAAESTVFTDAHATAPWTLPSLASLFTSRTPSEHRVATWGARLPDGAETLAEVLRRAGYRTGAFTSNVLVGRDSGFAQGFDAYDVVFHPRAGSVTAGAPFPNAAAAQVSRRALDWLRGVRAEAPSAPFFAYLHIMEPHTPYRCPPRSAAACRTAAAGLNQRLMDEDWRFDVDDRRRIRGLYAEEVAATDRALGQLLDALREGGWLQNTWLFVTADHGEQLGEAGVYLHGKSLDREEIEIPLLARAPDGGAPRAARRVSTPASLVDVAPTLLELAGVEMPATFRGRSLLPALRGEGLPPSPAIAELFQTTTDPPRHRLAVIADDDKLVITPGGEVWRFDRNADPDEAHPLPATRAELEMALGARAGAIDWGDAPSRPALDEPTRERLRSLGYDWD